ncbi:hypothetical protein [Streptomyces sp. TLI_105]|uniref:hypothetical protein n=1 Tax=Streptomyces sp. TLI_105 TaxID=1881019 RepID=UPI000897A1CA|nr:hypothetical protein [Streptomyces sp. TLI_105]SED86373.1 hypothetical protein SAMN05428939_6517 [Streptomyces sp. TLI_105]
MAADAVCATVLGLLADRLLRTAVVQAGPQQGLLSFSAGLGNGIPAALTCGLAAGVLAAAALRLSPRDAPGPAS